MDEHKFSVIKRVSRRLLNQSKTQFLPTCTWCCMVRSHLDYCSSVWAPYKKGDIEALEKVQKKATKILPALKRLPYSERLRELARYQPYIIDV